MWIGSVDELLAIGWWRKRRWRTGTCAACDRAVLTDGGAILDPEPSDAGSVVIDDYGRPVVVVREDVLGHPPLWRAHFYSCPRHLIVEKA